MTIDAIRTMIVMKRDGQDIGHMTNHVTFSTTF